jgi:arsenite methyltransferase
VSIAGTHTASAALLKTCCADLWAHPGIRLLVGDALRPGGIELTKRALEELGLPRGSKVLDVGCGTGATLRLLDEHGLRAVGADYSAALATEAGEFAATAAGDAERLPFRSATFDAVFIECVLSAVPEKDPAADELARVVAPGGAVVLSDVTLEGELPPPLDSFVGWIACAAGALSAGGYVASLERAGLRIERSEDHSEALGDLVLQARRRLALLQGALGTDILETGGAGFATDAIELGQTLLGRAVEAVAAGTLGYTLLIARRPRRQTAVTAARGAGRDDPEPPPVARPGP